ncbi:hypothetical protein RRG08_000167 [Elysia crispata]|uniref:Uncharacterized protein n=1 Tax=Elysia crispata TaxID=231223 RepID=A0AAE0YV71_9GAST|nr:hypothetical protein RRG08_000167 [Elysia crispata]
MTLQLSFENKKCATLISAYAPTMTNPDAIKDKFCEEMDALIAAVPRSKKLLVTGEFKTRVGTPGLGWHHWQAWHRQVQQQRSTAAQDVRCT